MKGSRDIQRKHHVIYVDGSGAERTLCGRYGIDQCVDIGFVSEPEQICSQCSTETPGSSSC